MPGWAILVLLLGVVLRGRTTLVVMLAAAVAGLGGGQSLLQWLDTLGKAFVDNRNLTLFLLTLPVVGLCEGHGLREWAARRFQERRDLSLGQLLFRYQVFRVLCGVLGLRLNGHPGLVRPLLAPMARAKVAPERHCEVGAACAAAENYGNFYGQNLSAVGGGVLMVMGIMKGLGFPVEVWRVVAFAALPTLFSLALAYWQFRRLERP